MAKETSNDPSGEPVATSPLEREGPPASGDTSTAPEAGATAPVSPEDESTPGATGTAAGGTPVADRGEPIETRKRFGLFKRKPKAARSRRSKILAQIAELPLLIIVAFLIAVVIKTFIMQAFYIPSGSMKPTLQVGDRVLVEKVTNWFGGPGYGDVVVFARDVFPGKKAADVAWYKDAQNYVRELLGLPTGTEEDYIKRVVALGGDTIRYEGSPRQLFINDEPVEEDYLPKPDNASSSITPSSCPAKMKEATDGCLVPAGTVFVMGDNRDNSADSRSIGPVEEEKIIGRAFVIIWPPSDFGTL